MQLINLTLNHWNFHCPVTGAKITSDGEPLFCPPSLKGAWVDEALDTPEIKDPELESAWQQFLPEDADLDDAAIDTFLAAFPAPNWLAFRIHSGTAFHNATTWFIIDMNTTAK